MPFEKVTSSNEDSVALTTLQGCSTNDALCPNMNIQSCNTVTVPPTYGTCLHLLVTKAYMHTAGTEADTRTDQADTAQGP